MTTEQKQKETTMENDVNDPIDERIQQALLEALGYDEGDAQEAYDAIKGLLIQAWDDAYCMGWGDSQEGNSRRNIGCPFGFMPPPGRAPRVWVKVND